MKSLPVMTRSHRIARGLRPSALVLCATALVSSPALAQTALADQPLFTSINVPGNLALALSVEFPTAISVAYTSRTYSSANSYLGYFDANKCYTYSYTDGTSVNNYFAPAGATVTPTSHTCVGQWSGNFLNWATMQTIDPFRWALTGGYRVIDTTTVTVVEKAWASAQGSASSNFPDSSVVVSADIAGATPFPSSTPSFSMSIWGLGNQMLFAVPSAPTTKGQKTTPGVTPALTSSSATAYNGTATGLGVVYKAFIRAKVCDPTLGVALLESNCTAYGSNYKPEGLIQQYANKIRFSAFGYLNDGNILRDGGVLRAQQKFVGPTLPVPGSAPVANVPGVMLGQTNVPQTTSAEWSATTGVFTLNPDATDAANTAAVMGLTASPVTNSGVINYLNKFGQTSQSYKTYDNVSELYYAAIRYFKNLSSVPEWTATNGASQSTIAGWADGFPVITSTPDPILYSCQRNFILGIGDVHTHADKNVPHASSTTLTANEPPMPATVAADTSVDAVIRTNQVGVMEGLSAISATIGTTNPWGSCCNNNSALIAGLAYDAHINDIRGRPLTSTFTTPQTIDTYWVDVQEGQKYEANNQFYLATKYGGFTVPSGYSISNTTALSIGSWHTNTTVDTASGQPYPDNYYSGGQPAAMQSGLTAAFAKISASLAAVTTSFATSLPQIASANNASFSSQYDANTWTGEMKGGVLSFDATTGNPVVVGPPPATNPGWLLSTNLATQFSGTGWNTNRRVVSWNGSAGVAFRASGTPQLAPADLTALNTTFGGGSDKAAYLNYLRGDQSNEVGSGTGVYRVRTKLLGDIVGSQSTPVGPPSFPFSDSTNPGYASFKSTWANRRTMVYVGANDGMLHAINGALLTTAPATPSTPPLEVDGHGTNSTDAAGTEMFAYVPKALFQGPNGTPTVDGLASLGNPSFTHHYMVNATPAVYDIDFARTPNASKVAQTPATSTYDWHSVLIGGLGKGGRAYFAIDVTDPVGMTQGGETAVARKVLWEFTNASAGMNGELGYSFGLPLVLKTAKYGWVAVLTSGYDNADGKGYFIFVNPQTGAFLEKVSTGEGSTTNDAGLAHANAFVVDSTNGVADSIYAGDLLGNLWRLDLTPTSGDYLAPTKIAVLTDPSVSSPQPQPVTTVPWIEVDPTNKKRYVMVGTGKLLSTDDIASTQQQSIYSIIDGTNASFLTAPLPGGLTFPYTRSALANVTGLLVSGGVSVTSTQAGWVSDLGVDVSTTAPAHTGTGIAWRVTVDPTSFFGTISFGAVLPNGDPCNPSGATRTYVQAFSSGKSMLLDSNGSIVEYIQSGGMLTNLHFLSVGGKSALVGGTDSGNLTRFATSPLTNLPLRRMNWRELQSVD